ALLDLAQQGQPVHARHVDVGQDDDQLGLDLGIELLQRLLPGKGEVEHVNALAHLAAKALAEQIGHIGFVINDQNADCHGTLTTSVEGYGNAAPARGRRIVNSVKAPSALSTSIVPPCACVTMS